MAMNVQSVTAGRVSTKAREKRATMQRASSSWCTCLCPHGRRESLGRVRVESRPAPLAHTLKGGEGHELRLGLGRHEERMAAPVATSAPKMSARQATRPPRRAARRAR